MKARIISKDQCPYCVKAKELLKIKNIEFEEQKIHVDIMVEEFLSLVPEGTRTVPQIWLDDEYVGGYTQLAERLGV